MDYRFYKSAFEPEVDITWPSMDSLEQDPPFVVIALERHKMSVVQDGYDYFGAYGDGDLIDAWAADQPITAISKADLPEPVHNYQHFSEA
jgi:hypothetical protein